MFIYHDQVGYDTVTVTLLRRMVTFLALFYVRHWMMATRAADAPLLDLQLIQDLLKYREVDAEVAEAVLHKLQNHGWYLTEECITFILFSNHADATPALKTAIASKISATARPASYHPGKPVFPEQITAETTLADLVGPQSYLVFDMLNIKSDWLKEPVDTWQDDSDYAKAHSIVKNLKVVNDVAERGIKMMSDYAEKITTDHQHRQVLLQVVEKHRNFFPSYQKKALKNVMT